jgi:hypothetical protein
VQLEVFFFQVFLSVALRLGVRRGRLLVVALKMPLQIALD